MFCFSDLDLKQQHSGVNNNSSGNNTAATAAAMLAANGYSAAFPFLQHFSAGTTPTPQQQQQRVLKYSSRQVRAQTPLANSTRPPMRTNNKQSATNAPNNQHQTPMPRWRFENRGPHTGK